MSDRRRAATKKEIAAYLLDRADQYDLNSGCWIALADAAQNIMLGEVEAARDNGDLDGELFRRLDSMTGTARAVDPLGRDKRSNHE